MAILCVIAIATGWRYFHPESHQGRTSAVKESWVWEDGGCFIHLGQRPRRRTQWRTQHGMYAIVSWVHILTVVNGKTDNKDKPEEDDSADEAEETPGTTSNPPSRNLMNEIDIS